MVVARPERSIAVASLILAALALGRCMLSLCRWSFEDLSSCGGHTGTAGVSTIGRVSGAKAVEG